MKHIKKVSVVKAQSVIDDALAIVQGAVEDLLALFKDKGSES